MHFRRLAIAGVFIIARAALAFAADAEPGARAITVIARDESGAPAAEAMVTCVEFDYSTIRLAPLRPEEMQQTDEMGKTVFSGLTAGTYYIFARTDRLGAFGRVDFNNSPEETLELSKPEPRQGETVTGKVVMAKNGKPVTARVLAGYNSHDFYDSISKKTNTDGSGAFVLEALYPGTLYIAVHPEDPTLYCLEGIVRVSLKDKKEEVTDLIFTVDLGTAIKGEVRQNDGSPAGRLWVYVSPMPYKWNFYTDKSSAFEIPNLPPSDTVYTLKANNETGEEGSVNVGPLDKGQIAEAIITLPPTTMMSHVQGEVVDTDGNPVPGATLSLVIPERATGNVTSTSTDDAGRFDWEIQGGAEGGVDVYISQQLRIGSTGLNVGPDVQVKEGGHITVTEGETVTGHRIVVALTPRPYLLGFVVDEQGAPVDATLDVLTDEYNRASAYTDNGQFAITRLPDKPYVVEVRAPGYQARIIEAGKDFDTDDKDMRIVLKRGPFPDDEPVWTALTGLDAVESEIAHVPGGKIIWRQCEQVYPQLAAEVPESEKPAPTPTPQPVPKVKTTVIDDNGAPVQRIVLPGRVYPMQFMPDYGYIEAYMMSPFDQASEIMTSESGVYELYPGTLVYAEDSAYAMAPGLNSRDYGLAPPESATISLYPAANLTLQIVDASGNPMEGVAVGLTTVSTQTLDVFPKTNASGEVIFERFGPGGYSFRVEEAPVYDTVAQAWETPSTAPTVVRIIVEPGKDQRETVQLGDEPGSGEALLTQWYDYRQRRIIAPDGAVKKAAKEAVAAAILQRLNALSGQGHWEANLVAQYLDVIKKLDLDHAVLALENLILRLEDSDNPYLQPLRVEPTLTTLIAVNGDESLPFLQSLAADAERPAFVRREALLSLSTLGTDAAVDAYKALLADAVARIGAPDPAKADSEGEAIQRTLHLVFEVIPTGDPNASSSEILGDIRIHDGDKAEVIYGGKIIYLDLRDGVWLIASIVSMPIP